MEERPMSNEVKSLILPSGRAAEMRKPKVRDLLRAHRAVGFSAEPMAITMALIAEVSQIDGRTIVYEDLLDLPAEDGLTLQAEVMDAVDGGGSFPTMPAPPSEASDADYRTQTQSRE
jgi:hypothetical protein